MTASSTAATPTDRSLDVIIVGAGFAGLYGMHLLRKRGYRVIVLESADDVGGTWYHNRYPGARCDIESMDYSYSFDEDLQQEWEWKERYASQPEILEYIHHVADRFDLWSGIRLNTRVSAARWAEDEARWYLMSEDGRIFDAPFCIMGTGSLSVPQVPDFAGMDDFAGETYHTAHWPKEPVDLAGKRVGIIGTGSSAVQLIPIVAEQAEHLHVFQRTPNFVMPAQNHDLDPEHVAAWKAVYPEKREFARWSGNGHTQVLNDISIQSVTDEERLAEFEHRWELGGLNFLRAFNDILSDIDGNELAAEFSRSKIREIVHDPEVAELLSPRGYPFGTKRLCSGTNYYETYNRPDVTLVDVRSAPIETLTKAGIRTTAQEYDLDVVIFGTGFDAMTGALTRMDVRGVGDASLREHWSGGPLTYLGLGIAGFPNLFIVAGPGSPSVLGNMVNAVEQHVEWIADCIDHVTASGASTIEADAGAEQTWVDHVNEIAGRTLYLKAASWYVGANIPGKPRVFMPYIGGGGNYRRLADEVAGDGYRGFRIN